MTNEESGSLPHARHAELVSASIAPHARTARAEKWTLKQVQGDESGWVAPTSIPEAIFAKNGLHPSAQLDFGIGVRNTRDLELTTLIVG